MVNFDLSSEWNELVVNLESKMLRSTSLDYEQISRTSTIRKVQIFQDRKMLGNRWTFCRQNFETSFLDSEWKKLNQHSINHTNEETSRVNIELLKNPFSWTWLKVTCEAHHKTRNQSFQLLYAPFANLPLDQSDSVFAGVDHCGDCRIEFGIVCGVPDSRTAPPAPRCASSRSRTGRDRTSHPSPTSTTSWSTSSCPNRAVQ